MCNLVINSLKFIWNKGEFYEEMYDKFDVFEWIDKVRLLINIMGC